MASMPTSFGPAASSGMTLMRSPSARKIGRLRRRGRRIGNLKRRKMRKMRKQMKRMGRKRLMMIFRKLVRAHLKAMRKGDILRAGMLAQRIMKMVKRNPPLKRTKAFKKFRMARAAGGGVEKRMPRRGGIPNRFDTYSPSFDDAEDSAEGMVEDDPEDFEDEVDEDMDYDMDGFGAFDFRMSQHDMLNRALLIGGYASIAAGAFKLGKMTKKRQKQALGTGMALVGVAFLRNMMAKREAEAAAGFGVMQLDNPHCMNGYGELEIMDGFGELEIMDGFGDYGTPGIYSGHVGKISHF